MKLFIYLLLQILVCIPVASLVAESGKIPLIQNHQNTEVTEAQKAKVIKTYGKLPLYFIENKGQVDKQVSFYERGAGHATFFTKDGVVLSLTKNETKADKTLRHTDIKNFERKKPAKATTEAVRLSFVGANEKVNIIAEDKMPGRVNYFVGNDKSKWRSNIPTYGAVTYKDIYKNIDIKFYGNNKNIEHDVIVRPGGDPSAVRFAYSGIKKLKVRENGDLEVSLTNGKLIEQKPLIYQEVNGKRVSVEGNYRILKDKDGTFAYGFKVASYDKTKNLVLDPVLDYSTYLGGSNADYGQGIAVDNTGAVYVTGSTSSTDFPIMNPIQGVYSANNDVFVTKINSAGTAMIYSTFLGGYGIDQGFAIAVDSTGAVYLTGQTQSINFPLKNPIQGTLVGTAPDAFVTKINPTGSALVYSTYLGGSNNDQGNGITVDATGAAYVTGWTDSFGFPLMKPIQSALVGYSDAFVTKINPAGTAYIYSTYLGGNGTEHGMVIAVDATGAAYLAGDTDSTDFPLMNPIQGIIGGGSNDAFITKMNPAGSALVYSTYLGGASNDYGQGIAVDAFGSAYVTGFTDSTDFPVVNAVQGVFGGGLDDVFVTKINPTGSALAYSTYLGGTLSDHGFAIAVDVSGAAYMTGFTYSTDFPLMNPIQGGFGGGRIDAFITKLNPTGSAFVYSTYLGGTSDDAGKGIAVDASGAAYVAGSTRSTDFPIVNAIQGIYGGGYYDAFISKISAAPLPVVTLAITPDATSVARGSTFGYNVIATNTTTSTQCFNYWENVNLPDGTLFPATDSLFKPVPRLCLNAGASKSAHLTHGVPMSAPIGAYTFNAYTGIYRILIVSEAHFNFNVTAFNPATKNPQRSWRMMENGFKK